MNLWQQNYDPAGNIWLSSLIASLPILFFFFALIKLKLKGYIAATWTVAIALVVALLFYKMPVDRALASVVYGFFGLVIIVPFVRLLGPGTGLSVLAASLILGIMILPTVITVAQSALDAVPARYYEGALALGVDHEHAVFKVVAPAAASGIMAAIVLGLGRAIGETMAVVMVAGNMPIIPDSLLSGVRTMTANIVLEMGYAADLHREALIATGVVLFVFILLITMLLNVIRKRGEAR